MIYFPHLVDSYGKCRQIYHTSIVWVLYWLIFEWGFQNQPTVDTFCVLNQRVHTRFPHLARDFIPGEAGRKFSARSKNLAYT